VLLNALMANPYLGLRLKTASGAERMGRPVSTVAPTELIEPTGYLEGNELVTLAGIAMNFQDSRTWDAYVERLAGVPVAGIVFNSGVAHAEVPAGLVAAGNKYDVPVLEASPPVNLLQVHRFVNDTLQSENHAVLRRSLRLADACAEMEARGTTVLELLEQIRSAVGGDVGLVYAQGRMVASRPSAMAWQPTAAPSRTSPGAGCEHVRHLNPVRGGARFAIAVRSPLDAATVDALLGPVGAIVSLHLNSTAEQYGAENDRLLALAVQLRQPGNESLRHAKKLMRAAGFDPGKPTLLVTMRSGVEDADAWQLRLQLSDVFATLSVSDHDGCLLLIGQGFDELTVTKAVVASLVETSPRRPAIVTDPLPDVSSLRTALLAYPQQLRAVKEPTVARRFDLPSVLATALSGGGVEQALRFVRPLDTYDTETNSELLPTLRAYLEADGSPTATAAALFIHRNSLAYRLRRISELLGVALHTLEGKTTCAVAMAVWDMKMHGGDTAR